MIILNILYISESEYVLYEFTSGPKFPHRFVKIGRIVFEIRDLRIARNSVVRGYLLKRRIKNLE